MKKLVMLTIGTMIVFVVSFTVVTPRAQAQAPREAGEKAETAALPGTDKPAQEASQAAARAGDRPTSKGMLALESAAAARKYLFVFFFKTEDERTQEMRKVFDAAKQKLADKAEFIMIDTTDPLEKEMVDQFKVSRAPMPFVFSVAPNGAIIQSFPLKFSEQQLADAFGSPSMEKCLKALQSRKYVMLCIQNEETHFNDEAMQGVRDFKADRQYTRSTEIVKMDPRDANEADLLARFGIDPDSPDAVTVLLAPPRRTVGTFKGATDKDRFVAAIAQSKSGCRCGGDLTEE